MAEPADTGEAGGGGVPWPGCRPPRPGSLRQGLEGPPEPEPEPERGAPDGCPFAPARSAAPRLRPFRLFNSIQLGLLAGKLVSSDTQFN